MQGSGTSHEPLDGCETIVRDYLAQGQCTLAMSALIQHHQDAIVSYCRCHLLDQELAREVAQEIFLTACAGLASFRGHSSLKTWLYGIALKKCLEVGRTRKRREALAATTRTRLVHGCTAILPVSRRTFSVRSAADAGYGTRSVGSVSTNGNS